MSEARTLYLMRHGAPDVAGRMLGRTDAPATPAGIAACVAQAGGLAVTRIVTSDLIRATASAAAVEKRAGVTPVTDARWREMDFGDWDGLQAREIDGAALARFWDSDDPVPPGGERWSALLARVDAALDALTEEPTLVVAHGGSIRAALCLLCGFDLRTAWAFDLPCASLVTLRCWSGPPRAAQITGLRA